jgi:FKBP-type peptidyl-prolyl cis-trans isomerase 2
MTIKVSVKLGTHGVANMSVRFKGEARLQIGARCEVQEMENGRWIPCVVTDIRGGVVFLDRH